MDFEVRPGTESRENTNALPRFALPEVVGVALSSEALADIVQQSVQQMAAGLGCVRLLALSYAERERMLRGVTAVGFADPDVRQISLSLGDVSAAERAVRTRQILTFSNPSGLPTRLACCFDGAIIVVPLMLGERTLAVLFGQTAPGVDARSLAWQERAQEVAARAALVVELERVSAAYQDELRLRQSTREIAAAILEGRPLPEIAARLTEIVAQRLREDRVGLFLKDETGSVRPISLRNVSAEYGESIARTPSPTPITARATATGLPTYARNVQNDPQIDPEMRTLFQRENITSILLALLHHGSAIKGGLAVYPRGEREFTPAELAVFQSFADMATLGVAIAQQLEQQRDMATMEERNRLAREIHDTVAQSLTAMVFQIETIQAFVEAEEREAASEMLSSAHRQAKKALEETRRAVQGLSPASLERLSLTQAIEAELRRLEEAGLGTQFVLTGDARALTPDQRAALLRITQESLANARKHAQAKRIRVGLQYGTDEVVLLIEDDGVGFDLETQAAPGPEGGYGLFGMNERARLLGGELRIESTPGWGTRIHAHLPYRPASPLPARPETRETATAERAATPPLAAPARQEPGGNRLRVLVVDDHALVRQGIRGMLEQSGAVAVIGEAANGAEAVEQARRLQPDVVLMDIQMPGVDGVEGLRRLHAEKPELPVVMLTTFLLDEAVRAALGAGARGYLLKSAEPAELVSAIQAASRGETLLTPTVLDTLTAAPTPEPPATALLILNEREQEILQLLAQGARNKEIAARLFLSVKTVEYHLANLFTKLEVSNRTEAVRVALERGLIVPQPRGAK